MFPERAMLVSVMKEVRLQNRFHQYALQGLLLGALPITLLAAAAENPLLPVGADLLAGIMVPVLLLSGVGMIFYLPRPGRWLTAAGVIVNLLLSVFELKADPLLAFWVLLLSSGAIYYLITAQLYPAPVLSSTLQLERLQGTAWGLWGITLISPLFADYFKFYSVAVFWSLMIMLWQLAVFLRLKRYFRYKKTVLTALGLLVLFFTALAWFQDAILPGFLASMLALAGILRFKHAKLELLSVIFKHPARCLGVTFLGLSVLGTLLLATPAAHYGELGFMEAAFTAVSAACVTGLTIVDIGTDLTLCGRIFLLIIIQLGGLGIMTLAALVLHALRSFSLSGEQLVSELAGNPEQDIFRNLRLIVRFTFITEVIFAFFLTWGFYAFHHDFFKALELGIFTSISAFCNAGFFPGAENLVPYAHEKLLLTVIALEIIIGGMAPAVTFSLLQKCSFRQQPFIVKLVIGSTLILLAGGTVGLLLFEWNGIFADLPWQDKIANAFFQSATLRTAGFNSVNLGALGVPAFMIMLIFMFIGGSPGGTAGGIKTTVAAVLALTFHAALRRSDEVIVDRRRIPDGTVIQAVAILLAALMTFFAVLLMLVTTQDGSVRKLVFEAVSALGTVGLSLGVTTELDSVGQIILMLAMFTGRLGPLTLFLLLSESRAVRNPGYPSIKIPLG